MDRDIKTSYHSMTINLEKGLFDLPHKRLRSGPKPKFFLVNFELTIPFVQYSGNKRSDQNMGKFLKLFTIRMIASILECSLNYVKCYGCQNSSLDS